MSDYFVVDGQLVSADELYHHGVKGMKWGVRKNRKDARVERKAIKKLVAAESQKGQADWHREYGRKKYAEYDGAAKAFEKTADRYDSQGKHFRAEFSRQQAAKIRAKGERVKSDQDEAALRHLTRAELKHKKAAEYCTKKRVSLGKDKVSSILARARKDGYEYDRRRQEAEIQSEREARVGMVVDTLKDILRDKS